MEKSLLEEFYLCTHLPVCFFNRYDDLLYQYPRSDNEVFQKKLMETAILLMEELARSEETRNISATVHYDGQEELLCTACYFDESLPELGRVVFGPYTNNKEMAEQITFIPAFAVPEAIELMRSFIRQYSHKNEMYRMFDESASYHFVKIAKFVEDNVGKNITLGMIAENLDLSKPYVCSIVKKSTNYTVSQFVAKVKVNKAKVLFWNGFTDIHEVSLILGYKSQSYFSRQFKAMEGVSPTVYVQNYNKEFKN